MPQVLVVADDLTGAMDTAHGFATAGYEVRVAVGPESVPEATVVAVNADTRYADPEAAASTVSRLVAGREETIYKKVDSTLRGNVVAEIDAAVDASDARVALVAPAFPATGRTTRGGVHRVDGVPLDETAYAADENGPETADLAELLSSSRHPVVAVDSDVVDRGPDAVAAAIKRGGAGDDRPVIAACDATTDDHLAAVAQSAARIHGRVVFVGSGGLAEHVRIGDAVESPLDPAGAEPDPAVETSDASDSNGAVLGIVGSVNERTLAGLAAMPEEDIVAIDPETAVRDPESAGRAAGEAASKRLRAGDRAVVTGARDRSAVEAALAVGEACGYDPADVRERVARSLSVAARIAVEGAKPAGLFVTGGDVAVAVFEALGASSVSLTGRAVEAGIPLGVVDDGIAAGAPVATKAGGFGGEEAVINCLRALRD